MNILAIDASAEHLGISITQGEILLGNYYSLCKKKNATLLFHVLAELIPDVNLKLPEIDLYVVNQGPGSYTGVRIGMGVIKTFAQVHQKPIVALNSLELLASLTHDPGVPFYAILNCTRRELFYAPFQFEEQRLVQLAEIKMGMIAHFPEVLQQSPVVLQRFASVAHVEIECFQNMQCLRKRMPVPDAFQLAQLGKQKWKEKGTDLLDEIHPLYIKKDVEDK